MVDINFADVLSSTFIQASIKAVAAIAVWYTLSYGLHGPQKAPAKHGRRVGAWLAALSVVGRVYRGEATIDLLLVSAQLVVGYFIVGFVAGYLWRKLRPLKAGATDMSHGDFVQRQPNFKEEDVFYEHALDELSSGQTVKATWARALAEGQGDDAKAKGTYIRLRVAQLQKAEASPAIAIPPLQENFTERSYAVAILPQSSNEIGKMLVSIFIFAFLIWIVWYFSMSENNSIHNKHEQSQSQPEAKKETRSGQPQVFFWNPSFQYLSSKVELGKWQGTLINVTNRANFDIANLLVGVPRNAKGSKCTLNESEYSEIHQMTLYHSCPSFWCDGISSGMTGVGQLPNNFPKGRRFCVVGLVGAYQDDVDVWFAKYQR